MAAKIMKEMLEKSKNISFAETDVKIISALSDESKMQIDTLAEELCK